MYLSSSRERFSFEPAASPSQQALFVSCQLFSNHWETLACTYYKHQAGLRDGELYPQPCSWKIQTSGVDLPLWVNLPQRGVEGRWGIYAYSRALAHIFTVHANQEKEINKNQKSLLHQRREAYKKLKTSVPVSVSNKGALWEVMTQLAQAAFCFKAFSSPFLRRDKKLSEA